MEQLPIFRSQEPATSNRHPARNRSTARSETESQDPGPSAPAGIEALLTSRQAAQVLKIHPKVLERMAKRGEVPALKVGKFWRYQATALDEWINSRLQWSRQPCRMKTSF